MAFGENPVLLSKLIEKELKDTDFSDKDNPAVSEGEGFFKKMVERIQTRNLYERFFNDTELFTRLEYLDSGQLKEVPFLLTLGNPANVFRNLEVEPDLKCALLPEKSTNLSISPINLTLVEKPIEKKVRASGYYKAPDRSLNAAEKA